MAAHRGLTDASPALSHSTWSSCFESSFWQAPRFFFILWTRHGGKDMAFLEQNEDPVAVRRRTTERSP